MAIGAQAKRESDVARLLVQRWLIRACLVRPWSVASLAGNLRMQPGEWVACARVIELDEAERFPVCIVVTLEAIGPEPASVPVLMTGRTIRRDAQECPVQVLYLDLSALACGHELLRMALTTNQPRMLALESPPGEAVIERLDIPFREREIFTIVFGVAADASRIRTSLSVVGSVQSFCGANAPCDFAMAVQTLESGLAGRQLVAAGAIGQASDRSVRT